MSTRRDAEADTSPVWFFPYDRVVPDVFSEDLRYSFSCKCRTRSESIQNMRDVHCTRVSVMSTHKQATKQREIRTVPVCVELLSNVFSNMIEYYVHLQRIWPSIASRQTSSPRLESNAWRPACSAQISYRTWYSNDPTRIWNTTPKSWNILPLDKVSSLYRLHTSQVRRRATWKT